MTYSLGTIERTVDRYVKVHHDVISIMHTSDYRLPWKTVLRVGIIYSLRVVHFVIG